jgi:hypothetical protein
MSLLADVKPTVGPNIIGGKYIGGNYYGDYDGCDSDGDGLGDQPYGVGINPPDLYPLTNKKC